MNGVDFERAPVEATSARALRPAAVVARRGSNKGKPMSDLFGPCPETASATKPLAKLRDELKKAAWAIEAREKQLAQLRADHDKQLSDLRAERDKQLAKLRAKYKKKLVDLNDVNTELAGLASISCELDDRLKELEDTNERLLAENIDVTAELRRLKESSAAPAGDDQKKSADAIYKMFAIHLAPDAIHPCETAHGAMKRALTAVRVELKKFKEGLN